MTKFYIDTIKDGQQLFFVGIDKEEKAIIWCSDKEECMMFDSRFKAEEGAAFITQISDCEVYVMEDRLCS